MSERRTPLYEEHRRLSAEMIKGGGDYLFPLSYVSPVQEHVNTRTSVGMQDLTSMGELDVKGPGSERLVNYLLVNDVRDMEPGRLRYSTMCNEEGGIVDDVTVYKFHDEHFMIVTSSAPRKKTARWVADHAVGTSTYVTDISGAVALISVQGPRSRDFLTAVLADVDLNELKYFRFTTGRIGETELTISRSGYTGELGYELYVPAEEAAVVWQLLMKKGKDFALMPFGVMAMHSLRLEKGYPLYGPDIQETYTPFHVGLDRWIKFTKREFVGRGALLRVQEQGPDERWVGLILDSPTPANPDDKVTTIGDVRSVKEKIHSGSEAEGYEDEVLPGREVVGYVTSSARGHTVEKMLAVAYVRSSHAWPGAKLLVEINGRPCIATVGAMPFFDPQGVRVKS